jgi:hypothetical protein
MLKFESTNSISVPFTVDSGAVSFGSSIKTLAFAGLTLSSNSTIALKIDAALHACDELKVAGPLLFRGTLMVWSVSGELKEGVSFKLFDAKGFAGAFEHFTLPTLPANMEWDTRALTNGMLSVVSSKSQP